MTDILSIPENYALFRLACPHYDKLQSAVGRGVCEALNSYSNRHDLMIADIGCGVGDTSIAVFDALKKEDREVHLRIADINKKAISFAKKRILPESEVLAFEQDGLDFLKDGLNGLSKFSCIYSAWTLHNWTRQQRIDFLNYVTARSLSEEGTFVLADKILPDNRKKLRIAYAQQELWFDAFDKILRPDLKEAWRQHYLEDLHPSKAWYESEALEDLKKAGFKDIKTKQVWGLERLIVARK